MTGNKPVVAADFEGDSKDLSIKKVEELCGYSRYIFDGEIQRLERIDTKISRYLAGSLILLGFAANWACKIAELRMDSPSALYWISFVLTALSVIGFGVGTFSFILVLRFGHVEALPGGREQLGKLYPHSYLRILVTLSLAMMEAATVNADISARKADLAKLGYRSLTASVILLIVSFLGPAWGLVLDILGN
ncbi:MAG: hypothetical protein JW941_10750 [Candidatus Coatesbacteria bacterium]|nr:hypothetical protein [Candidatus Coatesbacteria bacterium]